MCFAVSSRGHRIPLLRLYIYISVLLHNDPECPGRSVSQTYDKIIKCPRGKIIPDATRDGECRRPQRSDATGLSPHKTHLSLPGI